MQPCSREMQAMNSLLSQQQHHQSSQMASTLHDLQNGHHFDPPSSHDDFLDQILSSSSTSPWDHHHHLSQNPLSGTGSLKGLSPDDNTQFHNPHHFDHHDQSAILASKLRQHQISNSVGAGGSAAAAAKALLLQQQLLLSRGLSGNGLRSPSGGSAAAGETGLLPMPLSLNNSDQNDTIDGSSFKSPANDASVQALYNGFTGSLGQTSSQPQHFHHPQGGTMQGQSFSAQPVAPAMNQPAASGSTGGGGAPAQPRQRVRARRGQATDPHSIAERLRRERIAERMKALQELVPNANKTDKASMLDEIIDYVKFLQLQVKVLSMSRLGGAAAVAPLVADISSEGGGGDCVQGNGGVGGRSSNGSQTAASSSNNDSMTVTEHQVAKLMEEDMGSAMQYLQGKGLCLMPISLATAISTATCHTRNPMTNNNSNLNGGSNNPLLGSNGEAGGGPSSPSMSVLTVQSATMGNGVAPEQQQQQQQPSSVKDATSVSKP